MISVDLIKNLNDFKDAPLSALEHLARNATSKSFNKGEVICREGETGEGLFLIVSGSVAVEKKLFRGADETKTVARLGAEEFFGESAFLQHKPFSATIVAQEDTTVVIFARHSLNEIIASNPKVALDQIITITTGLSGRLRATTDELVAVFEIARVVGRGLPPQDLGERVATQLTMSLASVSVGFYIWNPFNEEYSLVGSAGSEASGFEPVLEPGKSNTQKFFQTPIEMSGKPEGLILYNTGNRSFSSGEKQMVESIAAVLAPALATARFREEETARQRMQRTKQEESYL